MLWRFSFLIWVLSPINLCFASGVYDFCVERLNSDDRLDIERFHAQLKYGDIDPGKEAARLIVLQRFRKATTKNIGVNDYNSNLCPGQEVHEITVTASVEQLQNLTRALGNGDVPGAAIIATDIAVGGVVSVVKGAGSVLGKVGKAVGKFLRCPFGC